MIRFIRKADHGHSTHTLSANNEEGIKRDLFLPLRGKSGYGEIRLNADILLI